MDDIKLLEIVSDIAHTKAGASIIINIIEDINVQMLPFINHNPNNSITLLFCIVKILIPVNTPYRSDFYK
jgi:hypothetical protein